jgi:hypothetical protein
MRPTAPVLAAILVALTASGIVHAQAPGAAEGPRTATGRAWLRFGGGYSDNIFRVPAPTESGTFTLLGVDSDFTYMSTRLSLGLFANFEWRDYSTGGIDDETYGNATFDLEVQAIPDRISWIVRDVYSQGLYNPFEVSSPGNRAESNEFTTGPRFQLPLGSRTRLRLDLLKGNRRTTDRPLLDSDTEVGALGIIRTLNSTSDVALNLESQTVEYESPPEEIVTESAYLSYRKTLATGEAYVALGQTRSERGVESSTTPYIDLSWSRDVTARSRIEIRALQQYGDYFDDPAFADGSAALLIRDVYEQKQISIRYAIEGNRNRFSIEQAISRAEYTVLAAFDYDELRTTLDFTRSLTEQMEFGVGYWTSERDYDAAARADDSDTWTLRWNRRVARRMQIEAAFEAHEDRALLGTPVEENVLRLYMRYALTSAAAVQNQ